MIEFKLILTADLPIIDNQDALIWLVTSVVLFFIFRRLFNTQINKNASRSNATIQLYKNFDAELKKYFPYYVGLETKHKKEFVKRVGVFIKLKQFIPRQCETNETINLLIAATAVQLTFGLNDFSLYLFNKILIYPSSYYSNIRNTYHKGEVNVKQRLIVLSAEHFLAGIKDSNDGINLGLHELAHALQIYIFEKKEPQFIENFSKWEAFAEKEIQNIQNAPNHFLRKYAATNINEMFAVCTENFFEKPQEFQKELPQMYQTLVVLYNQNPAYKSNPLKIK